MAVLEYFKDIFDIGKLANIQTGDAEPAQEEQAEDEFGRRAYHPLIACKAAATGGLV